MDHTLRAPGAGLSPGADGDGDGGQPSRDDRDPRLRDQGGGRRRGAAAAPIGRVSEVHEEHTLLDVEDGGPPGVRRRARGWPSATAAARSTSTTSTSSPRGMRSSTSGRSARAAPAGRLRRRGDRAMSSTAPVSGLSRYELWYGRPDRAAGARSADRRRPDGRARGGRDPVGPARRRRAAAQRLHGVARRGVGHGRGHPVGLRDRAAASDEFARHVSR